MDETTIDLLQIKIEKAKESLSDDTRTALNSVDWKGIIATMKYKKGYSPEQIEVLETETDLLFSGLVNTDNYATELETRLKIPKAQIAILIAEMNDLIFKKIKNNLIKILDKNRPFGDKKTSPATEKEARSRPVGQEIGLNMDAEQIRVGLKSGNGDFISNIKNTIDGALKK